MPLNKNEAEQTSSEDHRLALSVLTDLCTSLVGDNGTFAGLSVLDRRLMARSSGPSVGPGRSERGLAASDTRHTSLA